MKSEARNSSAQEALRLEQKYQSTFGKYIDAGSLHRENSQGRFEIFSMYKPIKVTYSSRLEG